MTGILHIIIFVGVLLVTLLIYAKAMFHISDMKSTLTFTILAISVTMIATCIVVYGTDYLYNILEWVM